MIAAAVGLLNLFSISSSSQSLLLSGSVQGKGWFPLEMTLFLSEPDNSADSPLAHFEHSFFFFSFFFLLSDRTPLLRF